MAINAQDILDTLANSVTHSTLTPGAAANAGASAKGQEVNAYAKACLLYTSDAADDC